MHYRQLYIPGTTYFFMLNLSERKSSLLIDKIHILKAAFSIVKQRHPFKINAIVILPDHLHILLTLPNEDSNYSVCWQLIKMYFSSGIKQTERVNKSRMKTRERGIWQRRFWEHCIRDDEDLEKHLNYIHYHPVKHGYVADPFAGPYSSIKKYYLKQPQAKNSDAIKNLKGNYGE